MFRVAMRSFWHANRCIAGPGTLESSSACSINSVILVEKVTVRRAKIASRRSDVITARWETQIVQ